jgi:hypothetical protein
MLNRVMTQHQLPSARLEDNISPELLHFLPDVQKELIADSLQLWRYHNDCRNEQELVGDNAKSIPDFYDHSFIVFPIAKAYEGFLKYYFFSVHVISKERYMSRELRIGRVFNPDLPEKFRGEEWIFDDVSRLCSHQMAQEMWDIWLTGRNHTFHYFPDNRHITTFEEAGALLKQFLHVMERALACEIQTRL